MRAIDAHPELTLQLVVGASALLDRYGTVLDLIEKDGFHPRRARVHADRRRDARDDAKSTGLGLLELPTAFERLKPDVVITVGDRFETMATALAATYMNIPLAHTMGGEVSGNIDESIRHAVDQVRARALPRLHRRADRIVRMGEEPERVHVVGCPRMDLVAEVLAEGNDGLSQLFEDGVGGSFDLDEQFVLVSQHPVTSEYGDGEEQMTKTLQAVEQLGLPAVVLWPNADAGSEDVSRGAAEVARAPRRQPHALLQEPATSDYIKLMSRTACLIGNSSSAIREGSFIGTPAVNIGSRQVGRQRGSNVIDVGYDTAEIVAALRSQVEHGSYEGEPIYGDGHAGERIADVLSRAEISLDKRMTYLNVRRRPDPRARGSKGIPPQEPGHLSPASAARWTVEAHSPRSLSNARLSRPTTRRSLPWRFRWRAANARSARPSSRAACERRCSPPCSIRHESPASSDGRLERFGAPSETATAAISSSSVETSCVRQPPRRVPPHRPGEQRLAGDRCQVLAGNAFRAAARGDQGDDGHQYVMRLSSEILARAKRTSRSASPAWARHRRSLALVASVLDLRAKRCTISACRSPRRSRWSHAGARPGGCRCHRRPYR